MFACLSQVRNGEKIGIVGRTGGGKSSLLVSVGVDSASDMSFTLQVTYVVMNGLCVWLRCIPLPALHPFNTVAAGRPVPPG
jgi:hypothetical protein